MKHIEMIISYSTDGTDFQYRDNHGILTRCRDCRYYKTSYCAMWMLDGAMYKARPDDFCSRAVKEE